MKKSMYRQMYGMPPLEEKKEEFKEEVVEAVKEADEIIENAEKEVKKKNGRKFTI